MSISLAVCVESPLLALLPNSRLGRSSGFGLDPLSIATRTAYNFFRQCISPPLWPDACVYVRLFQLHNTPIQLFQVPRNWRCSQRLILTSKKWLTAKIFRKKVGVAVSCYDFDSVCKATHCTEQISKWLSCSSVQFPGNYVLRKSDKIERKIESVSQMLRLKPKTMCQVWFLETFKQAFNLPFSNLH